MKRGPPVDRIVEPMVAADYDAHDNDRLFLAFLRGATDEQILDEVLRLEDVGVSEADSWQFEALMRQVEKRGIQCRPKTG